MPDGYVTDAQLGKALRRQSAALPVIGRGAALRVVLVTSRQTRRWVVPKGWIEPEEPPHLSAMREAYEEAGLRGEALPVALGRYVYPKRLGGGAVVPTEVLVFRLNVQRLLPDWPERKERTRRLFTAEAAAAVVAEAGLAELLLALR